MEKFAKLGPESWLQQGEMFLDLRFRKLGHDSEGHAGQTAKPVFTRVADLSYFCTSLTAFIAFYAFLAIVECVSSAFAIAVHVRLPLASAITKDLGATETR